MFYRGDCMNLLPIPHIDTPDVSKTTYDEIDESFVDILEYSDGKILVDARYYANGYNGAINRVFVRKSVADRLMMANHLLPSNYHLKIYDAWRPYDVQYALYDEHYNNLVSLPENKDKDADTLHTLARMFVSYPDRSKKFSFVHSSGGAVDLTIVDADGNELDMGTDFDEFSDYSATNSYEDSDNIVVRDNRRLLYNVMAQVGFTNYTAEWWHYDYGDIFWSSLTGNPSKYSSVYDYDDLNIE